MSIINSDKIHELNDNYIKFCQSVTYRECEEFYSHEYPILELSYNENPLGPGRLSIEALKRHAEFGYRYPPLAYTSLITELAKKLELRYENFLITPGSVAAIYLAVKQYADTGDKVIFSKSSIPWYRWSALVNNSIPILVPLMKDMNHDLEAVLKNVDDKTRIIIISNPHNPTGLYISESELLAFYKKLPQNILLIVDQAYYEYQSKQESILLRAVNEVPNLMLIRTFSKIHGLAGLRVGYGIANPLMIEALKAQWLAFMPSVSSAGAYAAYHALSDQEHYERSRIFNNETKTALYRLCEKYRIKILKSEANFVCVNVFDSYKNEKLFHEQRFRLTAGYFFGYPEWVRISFIKEQTIFIDKMEKIFEKLS
jgi:histidinol-phosphate aminotransferase